MNLDNFHKVLSASKQHHARLVIVTKNQSIDDILELYDAGCRIFGENKVQELIRKRSLLPGDINWHMIGTLQKNKVRLIASWIEFIHSVDSFVLATEINKEAKKYNRIIPVLIQVKIAAEESKQGFSKSDLINSLNNDNWNSLNNISVCGMMGMASFTDDRTQILNEFQTLKSIFGILKSSYFKQPEFKELSFGMSHDYELALEEGSTMIRVGSMIFENK